MAVHTELYISFFSLIGEFIVFFRLLTTLILKTLFVSTSLVTELIMLGQFSLYIFSSFAAVC